MADRKRWRRVPGWPGYKVSSRGGQVRSVPRVLGNGREHGGQLLTPTLDKDGYPYVTLRDGDREWRVGVAPLVLLTYRGPCPPGHEALHGNDVRQDVDLVNLRWGTHLENERDKRRGREERNGRDEIGMVSRPEMAVSPVSGDLLV